ncbi:MAG TPA: choice-of-anchor E domain-containing protein [Acetobacteraceae bacterium]|nr:choice-of-anchor E domain-containing protein [Acetobacteraceae bacterium]
MTNPATVLQQQTIGDTATDWSRTILFNQSDPSQGTLGSINVGLTADLAGSVSVESLEAAPSNVSISQSGNVSVSAPGLLLAGEMPTAYSYANLAAYDGITDYAGQSGTIVPLAVTGTVVTTLSGSTELGPFIGTGSVLVTVDASTVLDVTGPANLQIDSQSSTGATADLQFNYTTSAAGLSGGGGVVTTLANTSILGPFFSNAVTTAPQILTLADSTTGSGHQVAVNQFNPALGTLVGIDLTLSGDLSTSVAAENEDATPAVVSATQIATVTLALPDVTETASAAIDTSVALGGYDGTADYAGTSGTIVQSQTLIPTTTDMLTDATDLAAFTGTGTVAGTISSAGTSGLEGPGNLLAQLLAQAGATATVSYEYVPAGVSVDAVGWVNQSGGEWTTGTDWVSYPNPPASSDDVAITLPGTYTVTLNVAESIHSIVIDSPDATLVLDSNLTAAGSFILDAGTIDFNGGTISADNITINGGLITGNTVDMNAAGTIALNGGSVVATDLVQLSTGGGSISTGPVTLAAGSLVAGAPGAPGFFTTGAECFARGTHIATPHGAARVEKLAVGDIVLLASGGTAPITWIGYRDVDCRRHKQPCKVWPVRISRNAFGEGRPYRDLQLSPDHAVFADGVLIPVKYLINGATIRQMRCHSIAYFHIELPRHDVVLAEGLPVESYLDTGNRDNFANNRGAVALYPDFASLVWEAEGYAPLVVTGPEIAAVRRKIDAIALMAA